MRKKQKIISIILPNTSVNESIKCEWMTIFTYFFIYFFMEIENVSKPRPLIALMISEKCSFYVLRYQYGLEKERIYSIIFYWQPFYKQKNFEKE